MIKYVIVRLIWIAIMLFTIMSFLCIITDIIMLHHSLYPHPFQDNIQFICLDYIKFLKRIFLKWDWGHTSTGFYIWTYFKDRLPNTLKINLLALLFYIPFSIILGTISAVKRNSKTDHVIGIFTLVLSSIPSFIMVLALMILFGYRLHWFPSVFPPKIATPLIRFKGLFIPMIAISLMPLAQLTRLIRGELTETLESEYLLLVRTKGLNKRQAITRHAFRNSLVPVLPVIASTFVSVLMGSFLVEYIYNVPGIASLFIGGILRPIEDTSYVYIDKYILVLVCGFYTILSLVFSCIVDISYRLLDPRMKIGLIK